MKVFEAHSLIEAANNRKKQYETFEDQLQTLKKAFLGVADLGDDFQGKGADNIKDFYKGQAEIVDSWLKLVEAQIAFFKGVSGDIKDKKLSDSYVEVSFLDHELKNADLKATEIVSGLKLEMDKIIASISDIVDLDNWTLDDYIDKMSKAQTTRQNTIDAVHELDESLKTEYTNLQALDSAVLGKYSGLMEATSHGKTASPMYFSLKSFHSSEIYKNTIEVETQAANYIEFKNEQAEARRLQEKQEEEANKPWYLKALDAAGTFVGEVSGYYDYKRAAEGVDPVTGEKLTNGQRVAAGAMAAAGFIPIVGWAGRAFKGGKAIYKTGKGLIAADHALDAYKASKTLNVLKMTEMGAYGLVASNGFSEAVTGKDMFGNKVSEERRKQGLIEATLSLVGAGAVAKTANHGAQTLAKTAGKNIPLAKSPKAALVQKGNNILEKVKSFQVPTNVRVYVEQPATATGHRIGTPIVRVNVEKTPVKELGVVKMVSGGGNVSKGANRTGSKIDVGKADLDVLRQKWNVPKTDTVAVGKTDVEGLENLVFEGGSPKVRKEAGLPDLDSVMPDRPIKSPGKIASATRHAEEGVLNDFISKVEALGKNPAEITGTLKIHQSNPKGVCPTCIQGLNNPNVPAGVFKQFSKIFPNLTIEVTSETIQGIKPNGRLNFVIKNGEYI
ncbi:ribonuclease YeeF family protein [Bacillus haynesii]|uniref:ribonuclease YeeF family protein n=1 Tax=Bacillus haynesii TaxID=1925021 RepID=UPI00228000C5|nr:T7SS effector LXG polymorphic toxin [Bacillus haynesii]MCY8224684.1 T7SS effector LXG polymorphic toxin [Bacillus haynesii]MCY8241597.1 T7SS effector LXG polymorphic toxin [Bacillus haynesii]MCY8567087.1 T7SS effector LXG polymorphic toxin [Bacillus haynesii]